MTARPRFPFSPGRDSSPACCHHSASLGSSLLGFANRFFFLTHTKDFFILPERFFAFLLITSPSDQASGQDCVEAGGLEHGGAGAPSNLEPYLPRTSPAGRLGVQPGASQLPLLPSQSLLLVSMTVVLSVCVCGGDFGPQGTSGHAGDIFGCRNWRWVNTAGIWWVGARDLHKRPHPTQDNPCNRISWSKMPTVPRLKNPAL